MRTTIGLFSLTFVLLFSGAPVCAQEASAGIDFFESRIRPLLLDACIDCHGPKKQKGELRLDSRAGWMKGGASGPALIPGKPDDSLLISAVRYWDKDLQMPPKHPLEPAEVNQLIEWVRLGAPDPRTEIPTADAPKEPPPTIDLEKARAHWAFQPVQTRPVPVVRDNEWPRNEIDQFTLERIEKRGLKPAPDADRRTLLRRVTYDLTGLPPTPSEVEAFVNDHAADAFGRVVERLLASPRYGERWGRHWLDVVRYADTCGNASDYPVPQAFKYRNYVFQAFNDDLPFDQFVREQLAGDLLESKTEAERQRRIIATGYLAIARHFGGGDGEPHLTFEDVIENTGRAFLALSINCARCHDHKFDPISSRDYYALYGIFASTRFPHPGSEGRSRPENFVPLVPHSERERLEASRKEELAAIETEVKMAEAAKAAAEKEKSAAEKVEAAAKLLAQVREKKKRLSETPLYPLAYAVAEGAGANARLQVRGDPKRLGDEVPRGFLQVLGGQQLPAETKGSGRLELARWLTEPTNPLLARVLVNRLWQHHFGRGLVATANDFGTRGELPSHPELLDYLADRFVQSGWSIKAMHRLILLSRTWQLASNGEETSDPANLLWARAERRRLDAESIRDTLLFVGGDLDFSAGGEHPFPAVQTWGFTQHNQFFALYETRQRAVYQMQQRLRKHPFLGLFDAADTNSSVALRSASVTPLQSLFAMNDPFIHERAERFAAHLTGQAADEIERLHLAFLTLYARSPEPEEAAMFASYLRELREKKQLPPEQAWHSLARVLLTSNQLLYLD